MQDLKPIPESYTGPCEHAGELEEFFIPGFSPVTVYLPHGYSRSEERYNTFYLLHGGGGNEHSFFSEDGILKNMLDHMIDRHDMDPLIVFAPTYYPPGKRGEGISYSADAVKDFGPIMRAKIIPLIDQAYRTVPDRMSRGIGGFSMGAVATWYAFMAGLDLFHWFMPMSGDCWICGERGGGLHAMQTAGLMAETARGRDFFLYALIGDKDIAFPNLDPQMQALKEYPDVFRFGANTRYDILENGVHDYPDIRRYIYNALPVFFR